jgi:xanthine dehydrogenase accessory factor
VEPGEGAAETAGAIQRAVEDQRSLVTVTVVAASDSSGVTPGARMLVHPDGATEGSLGSAELDDEARGEALRALEDERSGVVSLGPDVRAFVESLTPPLRLLICGAGHDAIPLVRFASELGWRVEVVDDRDAFLKPHRFPGATRFVKSEPIEAAAAAGVDPRTFVVVMSHNFARDKDYLHSFLGTSAAYIGMLGPRARLEKLVDALRQEGREPSAEDLRVVRGPAGLDVGADGPEEVGWAITAEILAVHKGRAGGFLSDRQGPIHNRPGAGSTVGSGTM